MVELDIVLLYIESRVWGIIYVVGHSVVTVWPPRWPFPYDVQQQKDLDIAIDEVSGALSMNMVPPTKWIVCDTCRSDSPVRASESTT
jgi:hypothetical protein